MQTKRVEAGEQMGAQNRVGWWDFGFVGLATLVLLGLVASRELFLFSRALRLLLGFAYVLYVPGYCLTAALFPKAGELDGIERAGISLGLSVAVVSLLVLALDDLPWGIRLWPALLGECLLSVIFMVIAAWRRLIQPTDGSQIPFSSWHLIAWWRSQSSMERLIYLILLGTLLLGVAGAVWIFQMPSDAEFMTEFYLLGPEGLAENLPSEVIAMQSITITAGVTNLERRPTVYAIVVKSEDQTLFVKEPFTVDNGETWEGPLTFSLSSIGNNQLIEIDLYREGKTNPYRELRLWIDVKTTSSD